MFKKKQNELNVSSKMSLIIYDWIDFCRKSKLNYSKKKRINQNEKVIYVKHVLMIDNISI